MSLFNKIGFIVIVGIASFLGTAESAQQQEDDSLTSFIPMVYTLSSSTIGLRGCEVMVGGHFGTDALYVTGKDGAPLLETLSLTGTVDPGISQLYDAVLQLRYGVLKNLDLITGFPIFYDKTGWGRSAVAPGDLHLGVTFDPLSSRKGKFAAIALHLKVYLSTGRYRELYFPRDLYRYDLPQTGNLRITSVVNDKVCFSPALSASVPIAKLPIVFRLSSGAVFGDSVATVLLNSVGVETRIPSLPLFAIELVSEMQPFTEGRDLSFTEVLLTDKLLLVPSVSYAFGGKVIMQLAAELGLSKGNGMSRRNFYSHDVVYATRAVPLYGISFKCGYQFTIPKPSALASAGGMIGLPGDRDADSVPDASDKCKTTPEDRDGFKDTDGCPDYDNDADGVVDEEDGCSGNPEDKDGFEDTDGCPDNDNDNDGTPDSIDACPMESGLEQQRGCPDEGVFSFNRSVITELTFEPGASKIATGTEVLDQLVLAMLKYPRATIEFQVHTDNRGSLAECAKLSQSRAEILKLYLVTNGIKLGRIKALGLGSEFPVTDNSTDEGRAKNQRVEVRRID